jgi:hypothetical protein
VSSRGLGLIKFTSLITHVLHVLQNLCRYTSYIKNWVSYILYRMSPIKFTSMAPGFGGSLDYLVGGMDSRSHPTTNSFYFFLTLSLTKRLKPVLSRVTDASLYTFKMLASTQSQDGRVGVRRQFQVLVRISYISLFFGSLLVISYINCLTN